MDEFPDVKPFPAGEHNQHNNEPPLEDRLALRFDDALHRKSLPARAADITAAAARAPDPIANDDDAGAVGDLLAQAKALRQAVEDEREILNRPLLKAQRVLKGMADGLTIPMQTAISPLVAQLSDFMAAKETPVHGDMGARVGTRTDYDFEITDLAKLPLAVRRHPDVIAAMEKVIRGLIKGGARSIAGVQITESKHVVIR